MCIYNLIRKIITVLPVLLLNFKERATFLKDPTFTHFWYEILVIFIYSSTYVTFSYKELKFISLSYKELSVMLLSLTYKVLTSYNCST